MLVKFWESLGEKLADRWLGQLFGPASLFWIGGLLIWIYTHGWTNLLHVINGLPFEIQIAALIIGLLMIVFSASLVHLFIPPTRKLLEGQWPKWFKRIFRILFYKQRVHYFHDKERLEMLRKQPFDKMSPKQKEEFERLEQNMLRLPDIDSLSPTRLGNIQKAVEFHIKDKYGLDAEVCRPRLWLVLPKNVRQELTSSLSNIDSSINIFIWGFLFLVWSAWSFWAIPIAIVIMYSAYGLAIKAAEAYASVLESCFDLFRLKLYDYMGLPIPKLHLPVTDENERDLGQFISDLFRY